MIKSITENTLVPIGLAVAVIGVSATWMANTVNEIKQHREVIEQLRQTNESSQKLIFEINSRLSRIEWKLESRGK